MIKEHDIILACVAWLQHPDILEALKDKECLLIVGKSSNWKRKGGEQLRATYDALKPFDWQNSLGTGLEDIRRPEETPLSAVYCAGQANCGGAKAILHNKFWIFCDRDSNDRINPKVVMTGSANATINSTNNLENVIILTDKNIKTAYLQEMHDIMFLSEELDWTNVDVSRTFYSKSQSDSSS